MTQSNVLDISPAQPADVPLVLELIRDLARYEKLEHECIATEQQLRQSLFGERPAAEAVMARYGGVPAGFALFFHNFSTFLARPGLYLEDLFVRPEFRSHGIGKALLKHLARLAVQRGCGRFEWSVLDWNRSARDFYESLGAKPMSDWIVHRVSGEALAKLAGAD
ncbi:MAG: GNAT family N-acetyltransferase [Proteobacteria bacterium]|mgnify:CR=1 FL=1|nr:GNAT family N-acetyltransferase [Pseudomonadota bacterium]